MLIPQTLPTLPTTAQVRTRRPLSGVLANGLALGPLHAHLARHRPCVTHVVESPPADFDSAISWGATWIDPARVLLPLSDRAKWLAVAVQYMAQGPSGGASAFLDLELSSLAGAALDVTILEVSGTVSEERASVSYGGGAVNWAATPLVRSTVPGLQRLLRVPDGQAGATLWLRVWSSLPPPRAARPLTVTVYELPEEDEVP